MKLKKLTEENQFQSIRCNNENYLSNYTSLLFAIFGRRPTEYKRFMSVCPNAILKCKVEWNGYKIIRTYTSVLQVSKPQMFYYDLHISFSSNRKVQFKSSDKL